MVDIDLENLEKEFNLEKTVKQEIKQLRDRIKNFEEYEDPNKVLQENIARANRLLDFLEDNLDVNATDIAKKMESASKLLDTITAAAAQMSTISFGAKDFEYKEKTLSLKELEVQSKLNGQSPAKTLSQTNIVLTDRNSLLDFLKKTPIPAEMLEDDKIIDIKGDSND